MEAKKDILIVGRSGAVDAKIAENLAPDFPGRVIIAGVNLEQAAQLASRAGHGVRARFVDVRHWPSIESALEGVSTIICSLVWPDTSRLLLAAITYGCGYVDISPMSPTSTASSEALTAEARRNDARILLGAGMIPGLSSVFARLGADYVGCVSSVESSAVLSFGRWDSDLTRFIAEKLVTRSSPTLNGKPQLLWPFTEPKRVEFPPPLGIRKTYFFPFADQETYPATLGAHTAVSRLGLLPHWASELLALLLPRLRNRRQAQQPLAAGRLVALVQRLQQIYTGADWWGVHVEVMGKSGIYRASVQGYGQAWATALSAATFARALLDGGVDRPGIWSADQVTPVQPFLKRLASHGLQPVTSYQAQSSPGNLVNVRQPPAPPREALLAN